MTPTEAMAALGLNVAAEFVPFSRSRNAETKDENGKPVLSLNWKVTLQRNGKDVMTTDYSAGMGHCPGYNAAKAPTYFQPHDYRNASGKPYPGTSSMYRAPKANEILLQYREAIAAAECESGLEMEIDPFGGSRDNVFKRKLRRAKPVPGGIVERKEPVKILPKTEDVIYSLISDADVLNYANFEEWAENLGYDPDSRKGETIYRACLEIALRLRSAIGESGLETLQEAFQDY